MAAMSDFLENKVIDHIFRNQAYTTPTTIYLALFTTATTDAGGGTEATGGSYARQAVTFAAASGGTSSNSGAVSFTNMPSATITHAALYDASSGGNMLMHGPLAANKVVAAGSTLTFAIGDIDLTFA